MEPITSTNAVNDQETDYLLEKFMQDFNEFQEKILQSTTSSAMNFEELVDLYINHGAENLQGTSDTTQEEQFTALLQDFNEYETTLQMREGKSTDSNSRKGSIYTETLESAMMIKEMTEGTNQYAAESFLPSSQTANMNSHEGVGSSNEVVYIRYGDLKCYGPRGGGRGIDNALDGLLGRLVSASGGRKSFEQQDEKSTKSITGRDRIKRKYRRL